jgi:hypothetical protein
MHFSAFLSVLHRLGRWLIYEVFQLSLWVALLLHMLGSLRSAFGGGGELAARRPGPAIRPRRRPVPARGGRFNPAAA